MSYQTAQIVGRKSLSDMITQNLSDPNMSITGSITGAVSNKLKAKATRFKERFDPMNIARVLGGGLGAAVYGRVAGRSDEDMRYFANKGKRGFKQSLDRQAKQNPLVTKISEGQVGRSQKGDGIATVLSRIYNLLKKNIETEKKRQELDADRAEQRKEEKEKQHKEIIDALKGIGGTKVVTATKETKPQGGGIMEMIANMLKMLEKKIMGFISDIGEKIKSIFDLFKSISLGKTIANTFKTLGSLLANPFVDVLIGGGLATWFATTIASDPNFQKAFTSGNTLLGALGGDNALGSNILAVASKDEREKKLVDGANSVSKLLLEDAPSYAKYLGFGTRDYLVNNKGLSEEEADFLIPGLGGPQNEEKFGTIEDREKILKGIQDKFNQGKKSLKLTEGVKPAYAGAGRGNLSMLEDYSRQQLMSQPGGDKAAFGVRPHGIKSATPEPPAPNPITQKLQQAVATNEEAKLDEATTPKVISIDASKTQTVPMSGGQPPITKDSSVSVRNDDSTLHKVLKQNLRPV